MTGRKRAASGRSIDPGVASIVGAAVAAVALVSVAIIQLVSGETATGPSTIPATVPATETATANAAVVVISSMGEREREIVGAVATELRNAAAQLPLVVNDDFTENEYGWLTGQEVFDGGSTCIRSVGDGLQSITIKTTNGAAFCRNYLDKRLGSFTLRLDVEFDRAAPSFGSVWYRVNDDATSYYWLKFQPLTKSIGLNVVIGGVSNPILVDTYVDTLLQSGTNRIDLVVLGTSHLVYVNEELSVMVTDESTITGAGLVSVAVQLDEPDATLTMSASLFEVHGSDRPTDS